MILKDRGKNGFATPSFLLSLIEISNASVGPAYVTMGPANGIYPHVARTPQYLINERKYHL